MGLSGPLISCGVQLNFSRLPCTGGAQEGLKGHHDGYDGGALRIDVADFLRENASVPRGLMAASFFLSFESFDLYDLF